VNPTWLIVALCLALAPIATRGSTVSSTSIADGTYTAKVVKVLDAKHIDVVLDNGQETTLPAGRPTVDFSKVQANDQIKVSIINGNVMVYLDLTSH
jgi:hypothetical protein